MKKTIVFLLMGVMLWPIAMDAKQYKTRKMNDVEDFTKTSTSAYVEVNLDEITGVLTICYLGNAGSMEVTISQNGVPIENDVIAVSNGQTVIYNLSGYAFGDYLLTIETADGAITQYILSVIDD